MSNERLFHSLSVAPETQSVALAGTFLSVTATVAVNESAAVEAGFAGTLSALPVQVQVFDSSGVATGSPVACTRIAPGVWQATIAAPTVAGGVTLRGSVVAGLSAAIVTPSLVQIAAPSGIGGVGSSVAFTRAAA